MSPVDGLRGSSVVARRGEVLVEHLDGEAVLYDCDAHYLHLLNPSAAVVWDRLDGRSSLDLIAEDVAASFGIESELAREDVLEVARQLARMGVVVVEGSDGG